MGAVQIVAAPLPRKEPHSTTRPSERSGFGWADDLLAVIRLLFRLGAARTPAWMRGGSQLFALASHYLKGNLHLIFDFDQAASDADGLDFEIGLLDGCVADIDVSIPINA